MFAKLAQFPTFNGFAGRRSGAIGVPGNDNRPGRHVTLQRRRRPVLIRGWHVTPNGTLECRWSIAADIDNDDLAQMRRSTVGDSKPLRFYQQSVRAKRSTIGRCHASVAGVVAARRIDR